MFPIRKVERFRRNESMNGKKKFRQRVLKKSWRKRMEKRKKKKGGEEEGSTTRAWILLKVVSCWERKKNEVWTKRIQRIDREIEGGETKVGRFVDVEAKASRYVNRIKVDVENMLGSQTEPYTPSTYFIQFSCGIFISYFHGRASI